MIEETPGSARLGRALAWTVAVSFVVAAVMFLLIEYEVIVPSPPSRSGDLVDATRLFLQNEQDGWTQELAASLIFAVGFAAFGGLGAYLGRTLAGSDPRGSLVSYAFGIAGALGVASQLFFVGVKGVAIDTALCECKYAPEQIIGQERGLALAEGASMWLTAGFLVLAAAGFFLVARLALERRTLPTRLARYTQIIAPVFLIALVGLHPDLRDVFAAVVGIGGGILLPIWAIWLSRSLPRPA